MDTVSNFIDLLAAGVGLLAAWVGLLVVVHRGRDEDQ
jgi:hypothetical protein